jgi:hypothetical protein
VLLVATLPPAIVDATLNATEAIRANSMMGLVDLYLQLLLTATLLGARSLLPARHDPSRPTLGRYPAAFGLSQIYLISVLARLALLVVPGLVLVARWSVSLPALVSEDIGIIESLRRSWRLTARDWLVPLLLHTFMIVALVAASGLAVLLYPPFEPAPFPLALLVNLLGSLALVTLWLAIAAFYVRLRARAAEPA